MLRHAALFLLLATGLRAGALDTGEIDGAQFAIARPEHWNHGLLLIAHGYRPESAPLAADLDPDQPANRALIDTGWMIATTSYRRNGVILADAIADLDALRDYVAKTYGPPERVLIEGESMGGTIATLMAERDDNSYSGAIAIDAAFDLRESGRSPGLSLQPRIPLIFLTNQTELNGPRSYVAAKASYTGESSHYVSSRNSHNNLVTVVQHENFNVPHDEHYVCPAIFLIARDGHDNVNQGERLAGLRMLNLWLSQGPAALPQPAPGAEFFDATVPPPPKPSQVVFLADGRGFDARVTEVSADEGNVVINAQPADFARLDLGNHAHFQLIAHDKIFRVRYGSDFINLKHGDWIAFPHAEGFFQIARNFSSAAGTAQLTVGDTVTIRRYDDTTAAPVND